MTVIAYYNINAFISLHIAEIVYSTEDYVVFYVYNSNSGERSKKIKSRVRFTSSGVPYFIHAKQRVYLDECIKV